MTASLYQSGSSSKATVLARGVAERELPGGEVEVDDEGRRGEVIGQRHGQQDYTK
jgi:hypothetical protein